ncbi:restriction endonuclease [Nonomuraea sp. SMC257]|uniref:Restriction endonuclease n=1 Tax=Nonomuraea montanisoli TaxID=2741721 RepID=A0A7Y6IHW3_9ACTN|nr:restriction endonuclease [Nonomuraea montanisoli]NUW37134.1 restriction endonuclease [Nonomuraea montanisoli]
MDTRSDAPVWTLKPGEQIERKQLHATYGGRTQAGIAPSSLTPNVFLFTNLVESERQGYFDGWMPDGLFHFTGEGQYGDQRMMSGNASILNHKAEGRALRVFLVASRALTYVGEFELDDTEPYYEIDAPDAKGGRLRKVIVFRLRAVDAEVLAPQSSLARLLAASPHKVQELPIEAHPVTERTFVTPSRQVDQVDRTENQLLVDFSGHLRGKGHTVTRHQFLPEGEKRPLFTDLYDENLQLLVEVKGSATRTSVRMAIGQLADYGRFLPDAARAILLPAKPARTDLIELAHSQDIMIIWPEGGGYSSSRGDAL